MAPQIIAKFDPASGRKAIEFVECPDAHRNRKQANGAADNRDRFPQALRVASKLPRLPPRLRSRAAEARGRLSG